MLDALLKIVNATQDMLHQATTQGHGSLFTIFFIGVLFGGIIQYTRVDKFEKIAGFAMLKDTTVPKMLFLTVGLASIGFFFMQEYGYTHYHVKPILIGGLVIGGVIFGVSMAILGKCPGTGPISIAEGRIDVLVGAIGGVFGAAVFTVYYPFFKQIMGPDLGKVIIPNFFTGHEHLVVLIFGITATMVSILIPNKEYQDKEELESVSEKECESAVTSKANPRLA